MNREVKNALNKGLSQEARFVLGFFSALCALAMFMFATTSDKPVAASLFGVFCLLVSMASFTSGRIQQFLGSLVGSGILLLGILYLADEVMDGTLNSSSRSQPSVLHAVMFLIVFGLPSGSYILKARFGFGKQPEQAEKNSEHDGNDRIMRGANGRED